MKYLHSIFLTTLLIGSVAVVLPVELVQPESEDNVTFLDERGEKEQEKEENKEKEKTEKEAEESETEFVLAKGSFGDNAIIASHHLWQAGLDWEAPFFPIISPPPDMNS